MLCIFSRKQNKLQSKIIFYNAFWFNVFTLSLVFLFGVSGANTEALPSCVEFDPLLDEVDWMIPLAVIPLSSANCNYNLNRRNTNSYFQLFPAFPVYFFNPNEPSKIVIIFKIKIFKYIFAIRKNYKLICQ